MIGDGTNHAGPENHMTPCIPAHKAAEHVGKHRGEPINGFVGTFAISP